MTAESSRVSAHTWARFAHNYPDQTGWTHLTHSAFLTGLYDPERSVERVTVTEDPAGEYLAWQDTGSDDIALVQQERVFAFQFMYGVEAEIKAGAGRTIRVRIDRTEPA